MSKKKKGYRYPWRCNNQFKLLIDGDAFFSAMLDSIENASDCILFETYLINSGHITTRFIDSFCAARKRGVRVYMLLDEYGCMELNTNDRKRLSDAGVEILFYHPVKFLSPATSLQRDHRKLLSVDNSVAYIGGAGITDEFTQEGNNIYWHDVMMQVIGPLVNDIDNSFYQLWNRYIPGQFDIPVTTEESAENCSNRARLLVAAGTEENEILRATVKHIRSCQEKAWITSPYLISSWKLRRAIRHAARKGADVRLLLPGPYSDHPWVSWGIQRYYTRMLKAGVRIYEYQPRFSHAKIILCDDWFTLGSSNLDRWNQLLNLDSNIEIYDSHCNQQIVHLFEEDFSNSKEVTLDNWKHRPLIQHLREWIAGIAINILGYIGLKFKR